MVQTVNTSILDKPDILFPRLVRRLVVGDVLKGRDSLGREWVVRCYTKQSSTPYFHISIDGHRVYPTNRANTKRREDILKYLLSKNAPTTLRIYREGDDGNYQPADF